MKREAVKTIGYFAKQNQFGFWVGCFKLSNGKTAEYTNAKTSEGVAIGIVKSVFERLYGDKINV